MVEVSAGLLLGSEADAEAVVEGKKVASKRLKVTHILSVTSQRPSWSSPPVAVAVRLSQSEPDPPAQEEGPSEHNTAVASDNAGDGSQENGAAELEEEEGGGAEVETTPTKGGPGLSTMFVSATDLSKTDLLHRFDECCRFIQQGVEQGCVLVHWCVSCAVWHVTCI